MAETKKKTTKKVEETTEKEVAVETAPAPKKAVKKTTKKASEKKASKKVSKKDERKAKKAEARKARPTPTEARAIAYDVRVTPRKVRLVANLVRGMDVEEALRVLKNVNRSASLPVYKLIHSAMSNAVNNFGLDKSSLYISEIQASDGVKMKRYMPRAKGSSSSIIKRCSNVRVVVKEKK